MVSINMRLDSMILKDTIYIGSGNLALIHRYDIVCVPLSHKNNVFGVH